MKCDGSGAECLPMVCFCKTFFFSNYPYPSGFPKLFCNLRSINNQYSYHISFIPWVLSPDPLNSNSVQVNSVSVANAYSILDMLVDHEFLAYYSSSGCLR